MMSNLFSGLSPGNPQPFGAQCFDNGVNFSLFSRSAISVTLCLFEENDQSLLAEIHLNPDINKTGDVWHIFVHGLKKTHLYAYSLKTIKRDKPSKFLADPFAKAVNRGRNREFNRDSIGSRSLNYLGVISVEHEFDWEGIKKPEIPIKELIIYEMHVRGFTLDTSSCVSHKGTFLGLIEKIPYLKELGINAIELMPVQEFNEMDYSRINPISNEKLCDYWGYSTINYFSLNSLYASGTENHSSLLEFKTMVREMHRNSIEVILDVVFNHTGEGNYEGPTISFKGIDNSIYYILDEENEYYNFSGCGNTFNCNHPVVTELILTALRYFVIETQVDGFRFDLASILYRDKFGHPHKVSSLIELISQDPILSKTKLIAEPWDAAGLYQVGQFYPHEIRWSEWNGRFRDCIRSFFCGVNRIQGKFATRISGSEDLYYQRAPFSSINFITSHDGFSLADLVSYNQKHNIANGEDDRDGSNHNISWNCGVEGATSDITILKLRQKQMRNFHFALMISQGVPLIYMGDEYGHTKQGNNNTWCQDNKLNWFQWDLIETNGGFYRFYRKMIEFRKNHSILKQATFLTERDVVWHGQFPFQPDFDSNFSFIAFTLINERVDENLYIAFNATSEDIVVYLPPARHLHGWFMVVNTANESPRDFIEDQDLKMIAEEFIRMEANSSILLKTRLLPG